MLPGHVRFRAMGCDPDRTHAEVIGPLQVGDSADTGEDQCGQHGVIYRISNRFDPIPIGMGAKAVIEARTADTIAMRNFDCVNAGLIKRAGDFPDIIYSVKVTDGMHAIAQGHVLYIDFVLCRILDQPSHNAASLLFFTMRSAMASPADVMMSRLPA